MRVVPRPDLPELRNPASEYTFKHALTHEVAYAGILQERRRALHARSLTALESPAGGPAEQVERLAYHAVRGEVCDRAVGYLRHRRHHLGTAATLYREMDMTLWVGQAGADYGSFDAFTQGMITGDEIRRFVSREPMRPGSGR